MQQPNSPTQTPSQKKSNQYINLTREQLVQHALDRKEGSLSANDALRVTTGSRTGRSPNDRFVVKDALTTNTVAWGNVNKPYDAAHFDSLWQKAEQHIQQKDHYVAHLCVGADSEHYLPVTVINELAWHNLFTKNLFIEKANPNPQQKENWTLLGVPSFHADPDADHTNSEAAIIINFSARKVLICGTYYAGEMKKAMFSVLNYLLPEKDVLPMHCAANSDEEGNVALFFGLSGTGKTTLSADPNRLLIGDDEHGWSENGVFNFEGGCYAKCIDLSKEKEPMIWDAIRAGSIMENVILDSKTSEPDYSNSSLTQNTRAAYPRTHIEKRVATNRAGNPSAVIFLTCDLFGVLPPVSLLNKEQAAYHFLSGYTALVGSTEVGQAPGVKPTFSTCFGAPFFPRPAQVYADLLMRRIEQTGAKVHLVNTGWTGGAYGQGGERFAIPTTRAIVTAILTQGIASADCETLPGFKLQVPKNLPGVESNLLNPRHTWKDGEAFDKTLNQLIELFKNNIQQFDLSEAILSAGPEKV